jgi:Domain of unknown function (DUF4263)
MPLPTVSLSLKPGKALQNGRPGSIAVPPFLRGVRGYRGFNQIVDWFWKLNDLERTDDFENRFNSRSIDYTGLLIIGRDRDLEPREKRRLDWRRKKLIVNSQHIYCITFDELADILSARLDKYQLIFGDN